MERLVRQQLEQRRHLNAKHQAQQTSLQSEIGELQNDVRRYQKMKQGSAVNLKEEFARMKREKPSQSMHHKIRRDRGPSLE